jgi:hypothetical protein
VAVTGLEHVDHALVEREQARHPSNCRSGDRQEPTGHERHALCERVARRVHAMVVARVQIDRRGNAADEALGELFVGE